MTKPPLKVVGVVVVLGVALLVAGLLATVEVALLGLLLIIAAPLLLLAPLLRQPQEHRYDATGDDMAALIDRVGTGPHARRPRDRDRER
jgi:hypothetical protein